MMWVYDFFRQSELPPGELWGPLSDIQNWPDIDLNIESVEINRKVGEGTVFHIKRKRGGWRSKKIETFYPPSRFSETTRLPLAKMRTTYSLFRLSRGTNINIRIEIFGPLSKFWGPLVGRWHAKRLFDFTAQLILRACKNQHLASIPKPHLLNKTSTQPVGAVVASGPEV